MLEVSKGVMKADGTYFDISQRSWNRPRIPVVNLGSCV